MKLTKREIAILKDLKGGADIWGMSLAGECRDLERKGLVTVTKAMAPPDNGAERQPYFGCITSAIGHKSLKENLGPTPKAGKPKAQSLKP